MARNQTFDTFEFVRETAKGYIRAYVEGAKPKATLNWVTGFLKRMFHEGLISANEIREILSTIAQKCESRVQMLNRLQRLKARLKEEHITDE